MRVVGPDDDLRGGASPAKEANQGFEGVGHVPVAQVPGGDLSAIHRAIVMLGITDEPGILLGIKVIVLCDPAVLANVLRPPCDAARRAG